MTNLNLREADSPSSMSTYNRCPRQYYLNYLVPESESPRPNVQSPEALMGTAVHSIAERCAKAWQNNPDTAVINEILRDTTRTLYEEIINNEVVSPKPERDEEWAQRSADDCIYNLNIWLYRNIVRWNDWYDLSEDKRIYDLNGHRYLHAEVPVGMKGVDGWKMNGIVDLVIETDQCIRLIDFKTGSRPFRGYKGSDVSKQLGLYAYAYPNPEGKKVITSAVYLANDPKAKPPKDGACEAVDKRDVHYTVYNEEFTSAREARIKRYMSKFRKDVTTEQVWEAKPSMLCAWCPMSRLSRKNKRYCSEGHTQVSSPSRRMPRRVN